MTVIFKGSLITLALVLGSGCSTKNPEWLSSPVGAFCASGLAADCLKAFAESAYSDAAAKAVRALEEEAAAAAVDTRPQDDDEPMAGADADSETSGAASKEEEVAADFVGPPQAKQEASTAGVMSDAEGEGGKPAPEIAEAERSTAGEVVADPTPLPDDGSIPSLAFGVAAIGATTNDPAGYLPSNQVLEHRGAGALLNLGEGPVTRAHIDQIMAVPDAALRAATLSGLLTLYSRSMTDDQVNGVLNALYDLDRVQYVRALIVKLPVLLKSGDLERAKALRFELLNASAAESMSFSMLAYVASCYTMAGMQGDAYSIVQDSLTSGAELSADDKKLIGMAISVASGSYPLMQDFYDYQTDDVRLHAYLTLAVISRQFDREDVARRALGDAVKFIQKSSVKIDRQKALAQILALSSGVI